MAFVAEQTTGKSFRAQLLKSSKSQKHVLWIAESEESLYTVIFNRVLVADIYQAEAEGPAQAIVLYEDQDEDEIESIEIGSFTKETAQKFLGWLQYEIRRIEIVKER